MLTMASRSSSETLRIRTETPAPIRNSKSENRKSKIGTKAREFQVSIFEFRFSNFEAESSFTPSNTVPHRAAEYNGHQGRWPPVVFLSGSPGNQGARQTRPGSP